MNAVISGLTGGAIAYALGPMMKRYPQVAWVAICAIGLLVVGVIVVQLTGL